MEIDTYTIHITEGFPDDFKISFGPSDLSVTNIPVIGSNTQKYLFKTKNVGIKIDHDLFYEIEFNILDLMHVVKWDEKKEMFILKTDDPVDIQLKVGTDSNGLWVRVCN